MIVFRNPEVLFFIPLMIFVLVYFYRRRSLAAFTLPQEAFFAGSPVTWRMRLAFLPFILRLSAVVLLMVAIAGPRSLTSDSKSVSEGINILLALDVSTSMAAEDFVLAGKRQSRLSVVKTVVKTFINQRTDDRIGLVAFAARPYSVSPLTLDHSWLELNLERIDFGLMEDGTAIGSAIAAGVSRLRNVKDGARIIVLLTDGINNAGRVTPLAAARMAKAFGIKVYTIGAGTRGMAPYPVVDVFGRKSYQNVKIDIDEASLEQIANMTGGQYFRATDAESLSAVYQQIDRLEKARFDETGFRQYDEYFWMLLLGVLVLLFVELVVGRTLLLQIP